MSSSLLDAPTESNIRTPGETVDLALSLGGSHETSRLTFVVESTDGSLDPAIPRFFYDNDARTPLPASAIHAAIEDGHGTSSVVVVELGPGSYIVEVGGELGTTGAFLADVFMPGDLPGGDNYIDSHERMCAEATAVQSSGQWNINTAQIFARYGIDLGSPQYRPEMDADLNGVFTDFDLFTIVANHGFSMANNLAATGGLDVELVADQDPPGIAINPPAEVNWSTVDGRIFAAGPEMTINVTDESAIESFAIKLDGYSEGFHDYFPQIGADGGTITLDGDDFAALGMPAEGDAFASGEYTLLFIARDEHDNEYTAAAPFSFEYTIISDNAAPTAVDDAFAAGEDDGTAGQALNVLTDPATGDTDPNFPLDILKVTGTSEINPEWGTITVSADGDLAFTPNEPFFRYLDSGESTDISFDYAVRDALGLTDTGQVTITVEGANDAPYALNSGFGQNVSEDGPALALEAAVLANFTDDDDSDRGNLQIVSIVNPEAKGTIDTASWTYDPNGQFEDLAAGETATESFLVTITDGDIEATATLTVTIEGENDAPTAVDDTDDTGAKIDLGVDNLNQNSVDVDITAALLANDFDIDVNGTAPDDDTLHVVGISAPQLETIIQFSGGVVTVDPSAEPLHRELALGETQELTFEYTISDRNDGSGLTATATATVVIHGLNDAPTAIEDEIAPDPVSEDSAGVDITTLIEGNFADIDDGAIVSIDAVDPISGETKGVVVNEAGAWIYKPNGQHDNLLPGQTATDRFTITVSDENGAETTAVLEVTVTGEYDPVTIVENQEFVVAGVADNGLTEPLLLGQVEIHDLDHGDAYTFSLGEEDPEFFTIDDDGNIYVAPDSLEDLQEEYQYVLSVTVTDSSSTDTKDVTITVIPDVPPEVADLPISVSEDNQDEGVDLTTVDAATLLAQATDAEDDAAGIALNLVIDPEKIDVWQPAASGGRYQVHADGSITYDPNDQFEDTAQGETRPSADQVPFQVRDSAGNITTAYVQISIEGVNDAPVADPGDITPANISENSTAAVDITQLILDHFSDVDQPGATPLSIDAVTAIGSATGTVAEDAGGHWWYTPNGPHDALLPGQSLVDTFTVTVSDAHGAAATATLEVTIVGENDPVAIVEGQELTVPGVADNDLTAPYQITQPVAFTDADLGDTYAFSLADGLGIFTIDNDGNLYVAPDSLEDRLEEYTYTLSVTVTDDAGSTDTKDVTIVVTPDQPPTVDDLPITVSEDNEDEGVQLVTVPAATLLAQASDVEDDATGTPLSLVIENVGVWQILDDGAGNTLGEYRVNADGSITYDPNNDFEQAAQGQTLADVAQVPFKVQDSVGNVTTGHIQVSINGVNDAPQATLPTISPEGGVSEDSEGLDITALLQANFTDVDNGAVITIDSVTAIDARGSVVNEGGAWIYRPNGQFEDLGVSQITNDVFTVSVSDEHGATASATLDITIDGENDAPVAIDDAVGTLETGGVTFNVLEANGGDADFDPDTADGAPTYVSHTPLSPDKGVLTHNGGGSFTFDPNGQFASLADGDSEQVTFTYTIEDPQGVQDTATVTITVTGVNQAPTTTDIDVDVDAGAAVTIDLATNSYVTDVEGQSWTLIGVDPKTGEAVDVVVDAVGTQITLTPDAAAFLGLDQGESAVRNFAYTVRDSQNATATGNIALTIHGKDDAPQQVADLADVASPVRPSDQVDFFTVDLNTIFADPEGEALTFTASSSNTSLVTAVVDGGILKLTSKEYVTQQDWTPATITVTASDGTVIQDTFTVTPDPAESVEVFLVVTDADSFNAAGHQSATRPASTGSVTGQYYVEVWFRDNLPSSAFGTEHRLADVNTTIRWGNSGHVHSVVPTYHQTEIGSGFTGETNVVLTNSAVEDFSLSLKLGTTAYGRDQFQRMGYLLVTPTAAAAGQDQNFWIETPPSYAVLQEPFGRIITGTPSTQLYVDASQYLTDGDRISDFTGFTVASALHVDTTDAMTPDTGVYVSVVEEPTTVDSTGAAVALPESPAWIDEWDSHWVEVWAKASELDEIAGAEFSLEYNRDYFTATEFEYGGGLVDTLEPVLDDATGVVTNIGGKAKGGNLGSDYFILLGRTKFESLEGDNVPVSEFTGPIALGCQITAASFTTASDETIDAKVVDAPETELWAVPYDADDDGRITRADFRYFAQAYGMETTAESSLLWAAMDFNNSGGVSRDDFRYFQQNYGLGKDSPNVEVHFPSTFLRRWVGSSPDMTGDATLDELLVAANASWQRLLGRSEPIDVRVFIEDLPNQQIGASQITALDAEGIPSAAVITIDNDAAGAGWYADLDADVPAAKYDLYTTLLHELGHAYGFTVSYAGFEAAIVDDANGPALVGPYCDFALDASREHLVDASDVMHADLAPGVRKALSRQDRLAILRAWELAGEGAVGVTDHAAALHAAAQASTTARPATETSVAFFDDSAWLDLSPLGWAVGAERGGEDDAEVSEAFREELLRGGVAVTIPSQTANARGAQVRDAVWTTWQTDEDRLEDTEQGHPADATVESVDGLMALWGEDDWDLAG